MTDDRPAPRRARWRPMLLGAVLIALLGGCAFAGYWAASGGKWFVVQTPSMGAAAPVGTLLWVEPVDATQLHRGEFISFRPPGSPLVYSHRVYAVDADGTIRTKGDINASPDPWKLTAKDVRGQVVMRWWGAGWIVRALPVLVGGAILLWLLITRFVHPGARPAAATFGASLLVSVSLIWLRPLVRGEVVSLTSENGHAVATVVSTGLLPGRLSGDGGRSLRLLDGHVGTVRISRPSAAGHFLADFRPDLSWWMWVVLVLSCLAPALVRTLLPVGRGRRSPVLPSTA